MNSTQKKPKRRKPDWKWRLLFLAPALTMLPLLNSENWRAVLAAAPIWGAMQCFITLGFDLERPTLKRLLSRAPVYFTHIILPSLLVGLFVIPNNHLQLVQIVIYLIAMVEFTPCFAHFGATVKLSKNKIVSLLKPLFMPSCALLFCIFFTALSGQWNMFMCILAVIIPFVLLLDNAIEDCAFNHDGSVKTFPKCLMNFALFYLVPFIVLSSYTEFKFDELVLMALAFVLFFHFIEPPIIRRLHENRRRKSTVKSEPGT